MVHITRNISYTLPGGERGLGIPALIEYPFYDARTHTQKFPFRTTAMMIALFTQLCTSFLTRNLLGKGYFPECCDVLSVYSPGKSKEPSGVVQSSSGAALMDSSSVNMCSRLSGVQTCSLLTLQLSASEISLGKQRDYRITRACITSRLYGINSPL